MRLQVLILVYDERVLHILFCTIHSVFRFVLGFVLCCLVSCCVAPCLLCYQCCAICAQNFFAQVYLCLLCYIKVVLHDYYLFVMLLLYIGMCEIVRKKEKCERINHNCKSHKGLIKL
jgi:predicted membrane protein